MHEYYFTTNLDPDTWIQFIAETSNTLGTSQSAILAAEEVLEKSGYRPSQLEWIKIYKKPEGPVLWTKEYEPQHDKPANITVATSGLKAPAPLEDEIRAECNELADFLVAKNRAYGNSAAKPAGIFARRLDKLAQIDTRIDDKLNRLMQGSEYPGDDTVKDLIGYLILRRIVARMEGGES